MLFLYDDIGRGQLNMQLNKSDDGDDDDDGGEEEKEEEEEEKGKTEESQTMEPSLAVKWILFHRDYASLVTVGTKWPPLIRGKNGERDMISMSDA